MYGSALSVTTLLGTLAISNSTLGVAQEPRRLSLETPDAVGAESFTLIKGFGSCPTEESS